MIGKIKNFNAERSFGFIIGDDGNDYFFHISNVKTEDFPCPGMTVEFVPSHGAKGLVAQSIRTGVQSKPNRPTFFHCGNMRIRLNNIKDYQINMVPCAYITIFDATTLQPCGKLPVYWDRGHNSGAEFFDELNNKTVVNDYGKILKMADGRITYQDRGDMRKYREWIPSECLVITTYQGDVFEFFKNVEVRAGIDIYEKLKELDSYFL